MFSVYFFIALALTLGVSAASAQVVDFSGTQETQAQTPVATSTENVSASTESVSASTASVPMSATNASASGSSARFGHKPKSGQENEGLGPPDVWPRSPLIQAYVHRAAARWIPVALRLASKAMPAETWITLRVREVKSKKRVLRQGDRFAARAKAQWHPYKGDRLLVISLYPEAWRERLAHLEVRYLISAGFVEELSVAIVTAQAQRPRENSSGTMGISSELYSPMEVAKSSWQWGLDSFELTQKGISFSEQYAGHGKIILEALSLKTAGRSRNAARGSGLDFGDENLGQVDFSYQALGVKAGR